MLNKRVVRIVLGLIILGVLAYATVPYLYRYDSIDGIVNARTTTLCSPIEGVLHFKGDTKYGTHFKKGEVIGEIVNDRVAESFLHELNTEKKTLTARVASLDERLKRFKELSAELEKNAANYQTFSAKQVETRISQEKKKLEQESEENKRAKKEYDSSLALSGKSVITKRQLEAHEANFLRSQERMREIEHRINELENTLAAIGKGVFLGDGHNDSPYSKQRADQLVIEIELANTSRLEAVHRLEGIDRQIEMERERIEKARHFAIVAPFDALVWRMVHTEGSTVVIGSELIVLMDCHSIFLDVIVSETQFSNIKPDDQVSFRLFGETESHLGTIFALRGSGSVLSDKNMAASMKKDPKREFQIWISVEEDELNLTPENFYQVGRRVEVKIPRKWNPLKPFLRFWNVL